LAIISSQQCLIMMCFHIYIEADTLRNIGETYAREIVEDDFGAYHC